jgi:hypothetical protein
MTNTHSDIKLIQDQKKKSQKDQAIAEEERQDNLEPSTTKVTGEESTPNEDSEQSDNVNEHHEKPHHVKDPHANHHWHGAYGGLHPKKSSPYKTEQNKTNAADGPLSNEINEGEVSGSNKPKKGLKERQKKEVEIVGFGGVRIKVKNDARETEAALEEVEKVRRKAKGQKPKQQEQASNAPNVPDRNKKGAHPNLDARQNSNLMPASGVMVNSNAASARSRKNKTPRGYTPISPTDIPILESNPTKTVDTSKSRGATAPLPAIEGSDPGIMPREGSPLAKV